VPEKKPTVVVLVSEEVVVQLSEGGYRQQARGPRQAR